MIRVSIHKVPRDILVNVLLPYLDQVSIFRLARTSKTLYDMLKNVLPKAKVLEHFNWQFKATNVETQWKLARKRHETNKWCVGGCGKKRVAKKDMLSTLVSYGRARTDKEPLNVCQECMAKRDFVPGPKQKRCKVDHVKNLKRLMCNDDITNPFVKTLEAYETELVKFYSRLPDAKVGDVLIPKYTPYKDDEYKIPSELTVVSVKRSRWYDSNSLEKEYYMSDGSRIDSLNGQRWESYHSSEYDIYVKRQKY